MFWKSLLLPSFILLFLLSGIIYYTVPVRGQQDSANFLTYTNTGRGFTIKYPSDWTVNDTNKADNNTVRFTSADGIGNVLVAVGNGTQEQTAIATANNDAAKASGVRRQLSPNENVLELDVTRYFLSGHPAIRLVEIATEHPMSSTYYDLKAMTYTIFLEGKWYKVGYTVTPPEDFPKHLQTAQSMIDSFQIISRQ